MPRSYILGTGAYAPETVVTNADLEKMVNTSDAWISERTGIHERRRAQPGENTSDLALRASIQALEMAHTRPDEVDLILVATVTPDTLMPACAATLQYKLGAKNAFAFDISAACAGSIYGLAIADQFVQTGKAKRALVIGADLLTRMIDWTDRNTCVLFGDAAGAMVLGPVPPSSGKGSGILSTHLYMDGSQTGILLIPGGGSAHPPTEETVKQKLHYVSMNGREVYKFAVRALVDATVAALEHNGFTADQVDHVVAHQANVRIVEAVLERLKIPARKCHINISKYGNTSSASMPMTLDEINRAGKIKKGDLVAMMAIGAGMAWGTAMVRW